MSADLPAGGTWSDQPLPQADLRGRAEFAEAIARRIDGCEVGQSSTVFGMVGPWGSGKTTLLTSVVDNLPGWTPVWFAPWSVADVAALTEEFVSTLSGAFPESKPIRQRLAQYARFGSPVLKLIPVAGEAVKAVADEAIAALASQPAWHAAFAELSAEIAKQDKRVIVIIDDVDRLDGTELRALLRVVRLLGRFENVHYLMAYDESTIARMLESTGVHGASSEFMEKIVQYPFEVPPVSMVVRRKWSRSVLDSVASADEHSEHRDHLVKILADGLETPRAASRLREQMVGLSSLIAVAEVDPLDFTALTWLRINHHAVWDAIRLHPRTFQEWSSQDDAPEQLSAMALVREAVGSEALLAVEPVVRFLFEPPSIELAMSGNRRWRMRHSRYFDRYFQIGLDEVDVSEALTERILDRLSEEQDDDDAVDELKAIVVGRDFERSSLALNIMNDHRAKADSTSTSLLDLAQELKRKVSEADNHLSLSGSDVLLTRELHLALTAGVPSLEALLERFDYADLVGAAMWAVRKRIVDPPEVGSRYGELVTGWLEMIRDRPLDEIRALPELPDATHLISMASAEGAERGFLTGKVGSVEDVLDVAEAYVASSASYGMTVEYDLLFQSALFNFAVGDSFVTYGPELEGVDLGEEPEYEIVDRDTPTLTPRERRHFVLRQLKSLRAKLEAQANASAASESRSTSGT
ncbi:P-loop NTPase fold protein [Plantibacter sp. CFBP 8775]|uniref:P-loop NTPase fold protein n=1 Tax=Plantibacter sp. CFBP 8775 TaxID=2774038 RepID=UPI0017855461|nr:P-loop NTPase fold protein [Plantibacter sp. CFBP 8775]MBD8102495.1 hypothetical protein [Plantibacter sp. CFBP 8775]